MAYVFFFSSRRRHTRCALVTGVQTCALPICTCNGWDAARVVPSAQLRDRIHVRWPLHPLDPNYRGEVASRYAFDDGAGEIGFVSSISAPFCGDCHRARVSADGRLYTCLFAGEGADLRPWLHDGDASLAEPRSEEHTSELQSIMRLSYAVF